MATGGSRELPNAVFVIRRPFLASSAQQTVAKRRTVPGSRLLSHFQVRLVKSQNREVSRVRSKAAPLQAYRLFAIRPPLIPHQSPHLLLSSSGDDHPDNHQAGDDVADTGTDTEGVQHGEQEYQEKTCSPETG